MAATSDIIPTELTLEIGDDPSPERFMKAAQAFFGYVREISQMLSRDGEVPQWVVRVREGSDLLALSPAPNANAEWVQAVYSAAESGVRRVIDDGPDASGLPEPALRHLRTLSQTAQGPQGNGSGLRLWVRHKPVELSPTIARRIDEDWRVDYKDFGTVEGRLETIQDKDGSLQLQVRDPVSRHTVKCYFPEDLLPEAFASFRKRIEVSGVIHYRKNGRPVSIKAERIEKLPDDSELPSFRDVRGILRDIA